MKEKLQTRQILTRNMSKLLQKIVSRLLVIALMAGSLYVVPVTSVRAADPQLTRESLVMVKGHGYNLKLKGASGKVTWKTSNTSVVTLTKVSNTQVKLTAKGKGTATVSAKAGSKVYKCSVKVINAKMSEDTKMTLVKGKSYTLKVYGGTAKKWVSKDTSIATVSSSGEVTAKKLGKVRILAYVGDSILYTDVTVKTGTLSKKENEFMEMNGQHKTFDGLHIGDRIGYEEYCMTGRVMSGEKSASTVPVYNDKVVDIRDEKMFQKALRADKVVGQFYRDYITPGMDDVERLQAVFNFLDSRPSYLVARNGKIDKGVVNEVPIKYNGCSLCLRELKANTTMGFGFGPETQYASTAYAALYANAATNRGWAEAFEFLCVAAGLKAFMRNFYQLSEPPVLVNLGGYWVEVDVARYGYGKKGKHFNFSNGGDIDADGEIDVSENIRVGTSASQCQYVHLKSWNRYSSVMPKCYGHEYEYPDTRDVRLYNLNSKYEWKEFIEVNSKFYEPLVEFKNNWVLYSCRY